ncbi:MAG: hypothetical protein R3274_11210, partial [Desulfobacterales bacterium]|nr:hypothetical protein [Desulfobacterales bacterium]
LTPIRDEIKGLSTMRNELGAVSTEVASLEKDMQQRLSAISTSVDKVLADLRRIQSEMSTVSDRKLDKDALQLELLKARKSFQRDLDDTKSAMDTRIDSMLRKIKDLEKLAQAPNFAPRSTGSAPSQGSGSITEQEIKE